MAMRHGRASDSRLDALQHAVVALQATPFSSRRNMMRRSSAALLACAAALLLAQHAAAACAVGDLSCACHDIGGRWRDLKSPLRPVCTVDLQHQGGTRSFNVFLPSGYDKSKLWPVWVHIHGVYWATMGDISSQMGYTVPAMDATPVWDGIVSKFGDQAIIVYPQSTGDPYRRMFWNLPWWHCSVGVCIDQGVDDIGYMELLMKTVIQQLPVKRDQLYISGTSAGGMMVDLLLCKSPFIQTTVVSAASVLGGIGESFASQCQPARKVPLAIIHGETDPVIGFFNPSNVDGSNFLSTVQEADMWQKLRGCSGPRTSTVSTDKLECWSYCSDTPLVACGMKNTGHDINNPFQGYPFTLAWQWFTQRTITAPSR